MNDKFLWYGQLYALRLVREVVLHDAEPYAGALPVQNSVYNYILRQVGF